MVPTLVHSERQPQGEGSSRVRQPAGLGSWLSRTARLLGGTGGGPRRGNPIPQHRLQSKPAPNFPSRVEEPGAGRGPGEDPDYTRDPLPLALTPQPVRAYGRPVCGYCSPSSEPPQGTQERSQTNNCPLLPLLAPPDPVPSAFSGPCPRQGTKRCPGALRLQPRAILASLTSFSRLESLGAALAFGFDPAPPARASSEAPVPPPLGPGSARRQWAPAPRATAADAGSFSSGHHPAPPLTSSGEGGVELGPGAGREGPPRRGLRPAATCWSPLPAGGLGPPPLPGGAREALRTLPGESRLTWSVRDVSLDPPRLGGRAREGASGPTKWSAFWPQCPLAPVITLARASPARRSPVWGGSLPALVPCAPGTGRDSGSIPCPNPP